MQTGNNSKYIRLWYEVNYTKTAMFNENEIYKRYNCGGEFRKWYGNHNNVVMWKDNGKSIRNEKSSVIRNEKFFFKEGLSWKRIGSSGIGLRFLPKGFIFDQAGDSMFIKDVSKIYYTLAFLNSKAAESCFSFIAPTMNLTAGNMNRLPFIYDVRRKSNIDEVVKYNIEISKCDWDNYETSWDFKRHPLMSVISQNRALFDDSTDIDLSECYTCWENECNEHFNQLRANEEELNRIFIDIYGLQDELTPEVEDKDVTVRKADLQRDIKSLVSYAVGCMFGRYSLNKDGLAYAGGEWDESIYSVFVPDRDNIIPICDEEYFSDDIVSRFCEWVKIVYGEKSLETNLAFIARALGNKGNTSREVIRNYFLNDFFKDHCNTYSVTGSGKRPIYWLFDSGKQNGFKALIYMHRYDADTVGRVRTDYLHKAQKYVETAMQSAQYTIDNATSASEKSKATRAVTKYTKQLAEMKIYDEAIAHVANQRIEIDLDDGVKVNYAKFQGVEVAQEGKKALKVDLLAKI